MKRGFLSEIAYSNVIWMLGLLVLLLSAVFNHFYFADDASLVPSTVFNALNGYTVLGIKFTDMIQQSLLNHVMQFLLMSGIGFLLQHLSNEYRLIRVRSYFPLFLVCLLGASFLPKLTPDGATFSCMLLVLSCLRLFGSLDAGQGTRGVYDSFVLLVVAALFQPRLSYLVPAFWVVMMVLQVFSFKSLLASLLGILTVGWVVAGVSFLYGDYGFILAFIGEMTTFSGLDKIVLSSSEVVFLTFLGVLMISAIISFWPRQHLDKLRTRNFLNSILIIWFALLLLWLLSADDISYMVPLLAFSALVMSHFFSLVDTLYSRFMFLALNGLAIMNFILL